MAYSLLLSQKEALLTQINNGKINIKNPLFTIKNHSMNDRSADAWFQYFERNIFQIERELSSELSEQEILEHCFLYSTLNKKSLYSLNSISLSEYEFLLKEIKSLKQSSKIFYLQPNEGGNILNIVSNTFNINTLFAEMVLNLIESKDQEIASTASLSFDLKTSPIFDKHSKKIGHVFITA